MTTTIAPALHVDVFTYGIFTFEIDTIRFSVRVTRKAKTRIGFKPMKAYRFASLDAAKKYVNDFMTSVDLENAEKQAKKDLIKETKKNFVSPFVVGEILYDSWGYDQTNIDFFQIVAIKGKKVTIRKVAQTREYSRDDYGTCMPVKDEFVSEEITRMIQVRVWSEKVNIYINDASKWDGAPLSWSSYH